MVHTWIKTRFNEGGSGLEDLADEYAGAFRREYPSGSLDISAYNVDLAKTRLIDEWNSLVDDYARGVSIDDRYLDEIIDHGDLVL